MRNLATTPFFLLIFMKWQICDLFLAQLELVTVPLKTSMDFFSDSKLVKRSKIKKHKAKHKTCKELCVNPSVFSFRSRINFRRVPHIYVRRPMLPWFCANSRHTCRSISSCSFHFSSILAIL